MKVDGRVDGYWADHLDAAIREAIAEGHHRIALDCSKVSFLSSAGIGVLVKHHQQLGRISGGFRVVSPSPAVATVLRITRLAEVLIGDVSVVATTKIISPPLHLPRLFETDELSLEVFQLDAHASLAWRPLGTPEPLLRAAFTEEQCLSLEGTTPAFAIGVGAFGDHFADCRTRFGELISVAGATAYQPADGTNVADYLIAKGALGSAIRVLYGLACDGAFSHLVRFEPVHQGAGVTPSQLARACLHVADTDMIGIVIVAETAGLVGAALRRSPTQPLASGDFFAHPSVRGRLSFTAERAFTPSVSLAAGVVADALARRRRRAAAAHRRGLPGPSARGRVPVPPDSKGIHRSHGNRHAAVRTGSAAGRPAPAAATIAARRAPARASSSAARAGSGRSRRSDGRSDMLLLIGALHDRADPLAARARRLHQLPDLRVPGHHRRRIDHARRRGRRRAARRQRAPRPRDRWPHSARARWRARRPASCTRASGSTACSPASS